MVHCYPTLWIKHFKFRSFFNVALFSLIFCHFVPRNSHPYLAFWFSIGIDKRHRLDNRHTHPWDQNPPRLSRYRHYHCNCVVSKNTKESLRPPASCRNCSVIQRPNPPLSHSMADCRYSSIRFLLLRSKDFISPESYAYLEDHKAYRRKAVRQVKKGGILGALHPKYPPIKFSVP